MWCCWEIPLKRFGFNLDGFFLRKSNLDVCMAGPRDVCHVCVYMLQCVK